MAGHPCILQQNVAPLVSVPYMYTVLQMFRQFCLFMMQNAYVPEGGNEGTSISIFDFYGIKAL